MRRRNRAGKRKVVKLRDDLNRMFRSPTLTRTRIAFALAVAVTADGLQFFLGAVPLVDQAIDVVALLLTAWAIGFHLLLLPTFVAEVVPVVDMLPTWTACVIAVVALRKREQGATRPPDRPLKSAKPADKPTRLIDPPS